MIGLEQPCTVDVWTVRLDEPGLVTKGRLGLLEAGELAFAARLRSSVLTRRYLARRIARRLVLARHLGIPPECLTFSAREGGKPYLPGIDIDFNATHSGALSAIAVTERGFVGIDIEHVRAIPEASIIDSAWLAPGERRKAEAPRRSNNARAFLQSWTDLEAKLKSIGAGLGEIESPPTGVATTPLEAAPGYVGTVATTGGEPAITLHNCRAFDEC